jgi:hypothetical protein
LGKRAYTTTKAEAFSAPDVFYESDAYIAGDNSLTIEENMLIEAYRQQGRDDLAECVINGKKYQRLFDVMGQAVELVNINAMTEAFLGGDCELPKTMEEWKAWALRKYEGEQILVDVRARVAEREARDLKA